MKKRMISLYGRSYNNVDDVDPGVRQDTENDAWGAQLVRDRSPRWSSD